MAPRTNDDNGFWWKVVTFVVGILVTIVIALFNGGVFDADRLMLAIILKKDGKDWASGIDINLVKNSNNESFKKRTDWKGGVKFENLEKGMYTYSYYYEGKKYVYEVDVSGKSDRLDTQNVVSIEQKISQAVKLPDQRKKSLTPNIKVNNPINLQKPDNKAIRNKQKGLTTEFIGRNKLTLLSGHYQTHSKYPKPDAPIISTYKRIATNPYYGGLIFWTSCIDCDFKVQIDQGKSVAGTIDLQANDSSVPYYFDGYEPKYENFHIRQLMVGTVAYSIIDRTNSKHSYTATIYNSLNTIVYIK